MSEHDMIRETASAVALTLQYLFPGIDVAATNERGDYELRVRTFTPRGVYTAYLRNVVEVMDFFASYF